MSFQSFFESVFSASGFPPPQNPSPTAKVTINGTDASDKVSGSQWDDSITMYGGNDNVVWSAGHDVIDGGTGKFDTISYEGIQKPIKVVLNGAEFGEVSIKDVAATKILYQKNFGYLEERRKVMEYLFGPDINQYLALEPVRPVMPIYTHKDMVRNVEAVIGSSESDIITGDDHDNILMGGPGGDILSGKGGADTFVYLKAHAPNDDNPSERFTGNVDAILDFNREEGDKIDLSGFVTVGEKRSLAFAGEAPTVEADTPWGKHTYSENPEPYTINYERGVDARNSPVLGPEFRDEYGNPVYNGKDGISLMVNYGEESPFLITLWGVRDIQESDLIL